MQKVFIYTDGACRNNGAENNIGGYGAILILADSDYKKEIKGVEINTTNNRMEIIAVIKALEALKNHNIDLIVFTDSAYIVNTIMNNWKRNKNNDLWDVLDKLLKKITKYDFRWVRGHSFSVHNNRADTLANIAIDEYKGGKD